MRITRVFSVFLLAFASVAFADPASEKAMAEHDKAITVASEAYRNSCLASERKLVVELKAAKAAAKESRTKAAIDSEIADATDRIDRLTKPLPKPASPALSLILGNDKPAAVPVVADDVKDPATINFQGMTLAEAEKAIGGKFVLTGSTDGMQNYRHLSVFPFDPKREAPKPSKTVELTLKDGVVIHSGVSTQ